MNAPAHLAALRLAASTIVVHRLHDGTATQRPLANRAQRRALAKAYARAKKGGGK